MNPYSIIIDEVIIKFRLIVIPAKAGIQDSYVGALDPGSHQGDIYLALLPRRQKNASTK